MNKELSEMTLEALWELFPISLVDYRETWKDDYEKIEAELKILLSQCLVYRISHFGSCFTEKFKDLCYNSYT